jgi:adenylyltransferase/sulfurtransferase
MSLNQDQINRYSRHLLLPEVGVEGQEKICNAKVLCIGTGGLGAPIGLYLAAAGVGTLGLVDFDVVDLSNLQRQVIHGESTVDKLKVDSAKARIGDLNSSIDVITYNTRLTSENALEIFKDYDIIVDGTDNFPTRYLANDACVLLGKPYIYGCILRFDGQASVFHAKEGPCYRCLFPEPPPPGLVPSWPFALVRCDGNEIQGNETAQRQKLSHLWRQSDDQRTDRLRAVLRQFPARRIAGRSGDGNRCGGSQKNAG